MATADYKGYTIDTRSAEGYRGFIALVVKQGETLLRQSTSGRSAAEALAMAKAWVDVVAANAYTAASETLGELGIPNHDLVDVDADGHVGVGGSAPASVRGIYIDATDSPSANATDALRIDNDAIVGMQLNNTSVSGNPWELLSFNNGNFAVSVPGSGKTELTLTLAGNLTITGTLTEGSASRGKINRAPVNRRGMLDKLRGLPIETWEYAADPGVVHVGPMAEDVFAAYGYGGGSEGLQPRALASIALAAAQELDERVSRLEAQHGNGAP